MKLYFLSSRGEKRLVKENVEVSEAAKEMGNYVKSLNPNYQIYYIRSWYREDYKGTMYDVGSHSEFFLLAD